MTIYVRESSTWREIQQPYVRTAGVWREITNQSVRNAGTWRDVFPAKGELYTWGYNSRTNFTPLGNNAVDASNRCTPVTTFAGGTNWKQVSFGGLHGAGIKTDGTLWTWGYNIVGQLGTNDTTVKNTPVTTFSGGTNWKQVSCGGNSTAAIKTDGTLWTWGGNSYGQLGINLAGANGRTTPVTTFAGGTNWRQVSFSGDSGRNSTIAAIKTDGTLWTWGSNAYGQLGINVGYATILRVCTPVTTFAGGTNWKQVSSGCGFNSAIKTDGTLWTWGGNNGGQLGNNNPGINSGRINTPITTFAGGTNWKELSTGSSISSNLMGSFSAMAAIKTDGTLWLWGNNSNGELGVNDTLRRCTPVTTFAGGTNWKKVSVTAQSFSHHTLAIKTDGTLWTWGDNSQGQLGINLAGLPVPTTRCTPVTTFAGGTNWKQVSSSLRLSAAIS